MLVRTVVVSVLSGKATRDCAAFGWAEGYSLLFCQGQPVELEPSSALYAAIGAGNLRAFVDGQDTVSHAASN